MAEVSKAMPMPVYQNGTEVTAPLPSNSAKLGGHVHSFNWKWTLTHTSS